LSSCGYAIAQNEQQENAILQRTPLIIRIFQVVRIHPNVVWFGIAMEAHSFNVVLSLQERLANAMHSIHYPAVTRENHWESKVRILHQSSVIHNLTTRHSRTFIRPVGLIQFANEREWYRFARKIAGQFDEPMNIPDKETAR
jgi:hypothetical protein